MVISIPYILGIVLIITAFNVPMLLAGIVLTRLFGPDGIEFTSVVTVNRWFVRYRGRVMALTSLALASELMVAGAFDSLSGAWGWRRATLALSTLVASLILLGCALLRDSPEQLGLLPDGNPTCA
eukprot:CAMPEP_0113662882 /NCGR_PEP_ID=MMETSP0038_2-20120614/824_1 /TAXON_ID=2898 /ORGANISM="Cryptomonas paramecium" /LENGTH=124 /DNA_ID=CAMNT_0000577829 /DNA_START=264 /DNA_END=635 /DNA_ORIENTATION=+ /assembly_acc=CAM_ASM_000170